MGAKTSFIFAAESADPGFWKRAIAGLEPEIHRALGPLKTVSIHDFESDNIRESRLHTTPSKSMPSFGEQGIATFYSENMDDGCVMLTYEGRFMVTAIALKCAPNGIDLLLRCWQKIGRELSAAFMGEELEIGEAELEVFIREGRIPEQANLCEAAIVAKKFKTIEMVVVQDVEYGAALLRS